MAKKGIAKSKLKPSVEITDDDVRIAFREIAVIGDASPNVIMNATFPNLIQEENFKLKLGEFIIDLKITRDGKK